MRPTRLGGSDGAALHHLLVPMTHGAIIRKELQNVKFSASVKAPSSATGVPQLTLLPLGLVLVTSLLVYRASSWGPGIFSVFSFLCLCRSLTS